MWMAFTGLVQAKWTDEIHDEWMRNRLKQKPHLERKSIEWTRDQMNAAVPDCLVEGHEDLIPSLRHGANLESRHGDARAPRCQGVATGPLRIQQILTWLSFIA
jgi:hypothetical protein